MFYNVRHQIAQLILNALHRLFSLQHNFDTRRLMLEVCEVVVKWEQDRQMAIAESSKEAEGTKTENSTTTAAVDVDEPVVSEQKERKTEVR